MFFNICFYRRFVFTLEFWVYFFFVLRISYLPAMGYCGGRGGDFTGGGGLEALAWNLLCFENFPFVGFLWGNN